MSDLSDTPSIQLAIGGHNPLGIICVSVNEIKIQKTTGGKCELVDAMTFVMPLEDAPYYLPDNRSIFEASLDEDKSGFWLTLPARNAFDIHQTKTIAMKAAADFPKAKQEDLMNQVQLSIEKHSAPYSGSKKEVHLPPAAGSETPISVDVPMTHLHFKFPDGITCSKLDFKGEADENELDLKVGIFPVSNYPDPDKVTDCFKKNYVLLQQDFPHEEAKVIATLAFSRTYVEEIVAKMLRSTAYAKIVMLKENHGVDKSFGGKKPAPKDTTFDFSELFSSMPSA